MRQEHEPFYRYHIEHVLPRQHGGNDDEPNLALACNHCNLHKGPNLAGIDPQTHTVIPLFDPRRQLWDEHFALEGASIVGLTPTGRATLSVLAMNAPVRLELRAELIENGQLI
jgi:hypothetical protein